ncbi:MULTISPECIES: PAS domain-containing protein [unclassified Streptomyces]|uniref:PAS domain-containing protein n=1 Tax=unclassified Streptomyces TaxID=2593676 RepID=UPI0037F2439A
MGHGTESDAPADRTVAGTGAAPVPPDAGTAPLAVVVVDRAGLVAHWSDGAAQLFGAAREDAVGRSALDLLPVSGALPDIDEDLPYDGFGPGVHEAAPHEAGTEEASGAASDGALGHPAAGRARLTVPGRDRVDVLWWAYPLVGPGTGRLLVLAADAHALHPPAPFDGLGAAGAVERLAPGFGLHTDVPGAAGLARRLPEILPGLDARDSARIVGQILELGYPILEFSHEDRVPVTPDWSVSRPAPRDASDALPGMRTGPGRR